MGNLIASFLVGLIVGVLLCSAAFDNLRGRQIHAGVMLVGDKAYRVTPMEND